ncbi:MAG: ABC transporter substrate-binding protein [Spirochaetaceae bacterium]|jgi:peptide/nickel transport system substrate-binding protein|nr:ABC transporter substrate-binding protein [Spirochaetaceae bacterium]
MKKLMVFALAFSVTAGAVFANGTGETAVATGTVSQLPRNETLYFNGIQWGAPVALSPYHANRNYGFVDVQRQVVFETLFLYNPLDAKLYPQIGDSYKWDGNNVTIALNKKVKFSDGTPLTAADVVNSYQLAKEYSVNYSGYWAYINSIKVVDDYTVLIEGNPATINPKYIEQSLSELYITSKKYWDGKKASGALGTSKTALLEFLGWDCPGTGPYRPLIQDETKVVVQRFDGYWGQDPSRWGKLPAPKYLGMNVYKDNASGDAAFRAGQVDVSQQFISQVWKIWDAKLPVETYLPQPPYYVPGVIPCIVFNTTRPGLKDAVVRRAIAMSLDYNTIGQNAMSGYTATYVPSLMLPTAPEQALIDTNQLKAYQWKSDLSAARADANKLLDDAGWVKGSDGIRAKGGVKLSFKAECPAGWSDWNASLEVVSQSTKAIGIDISTYFPDAPIWQSDIDNTSFDIIMYSPGGSNIASPWSRAYFLSSENLSPPGTPNKVHNWGRWENARANEIIKALITEKDAAQLKALWTELNIIYLQEMPMAGLMYRPALFHTVYTGIWTGFPKQNDGSQIPPLICIDGYGIAALYKIRAK